MNSTFQLISLSTSKSATVLLAMALMVDALS